MTGTIQSRYTGIEVARVFMPRDQDHPETVISEVERISQGCGGVLEVVYCDCIWHIQMSQEPTQIRSQYMPKVRKAYESARRHRLNRPIA